LINKINFSDINKINHFFGKSQLNAYIYYKQLTNYKKDNNKI